MVGSPAGMETDVDTASVSSSTSDPKKKHECPVSGCLSSFPSSSKLDRHMRVHSGLRPFLCKSCNTSFTQMSSLKTHQKRASHNGFLIDEAVKKLEAEYAANARSDNLPPMSPVPAPSRPHAAAAAAAAAARSPPARSLSRRSSAAGVAVATAAAVAANSESGDTIAKPTKQKKKKKRSTDQSTRYKTHPYQANTTGHIRTTHSSSSTSTPAAAGRVAGAAEAMPVPQLPPHGIPPLPAAQMHTWPLKGEDMSLAPLSSLFTPPTSCDIDAPGEFPAFPDAGMSFEQAPVDMGFIAGEASNSKDDVEMVAAMKDMSFASRRHSVATPYHPPQQHQYHDAVVVPNPAARTTDAAAAAAAAAAASGAASGAFVASAASHTSFLPAHQQYQHQHQQYQHQYQHQHFPAHAGLRRHTASSLPANFSMSSVEIDVGGAPGVAYAQVHGLSATLPSHLDLGVSDITMFASVPHDAQPVAPDQQALAQQQQQHHLWQMHQYERQEKEARAAHALAVHREQQEYDRRQELLAIRHHQAALLAAAQQKAAAQMGADLFEL